MLVLNCKMTFVFDAGSVYKNLVFDFVNEIEISKSRDTLTNTCKIKLPRKIKVLEGKNLNDVLKRGATVKIELGYDGEYRTEFTGYITKIDAQIPLTVFCEDEMWKLKQNSISKSFQNTTLKNLVSNIYDGKFKVADIKIGDFVIKQQSTAQVLDALKKFGLHAYFDALGVLIVDFASSLKELKNEVRYDFNKNVIDNDLLFTSKDDIRIKVKGISKTATGKKIEFITGDADGDERTLNYVNIDAADLKKIVTEELNKLKKDGLQNGITTFGIPYIEHGDIAILNDIENPERNGSFLVKAVTTTFGVNGFRRKVELERKLA